LEPRHDQIPILYLHWIDYVTEDKSVYDQLVTEKIGNRFFNNDDNALKICVIDHAEAIGQVEQFLELCKKFSNEHRIFIFLYKHDAADRTNWQHIVTAARTTDEDEKDCFLGIKRSENYYYQAKPYTFDQCVTVFDSSISNKTICDACKNIVKTLPNELRRPYNFDRLITELSGYTDVNQLPIAFNSPKLINKVYSYSVKDALEHLSGYATFDGF